MRRLFRCFFLAPLIAALIGCTSLRVVYDANLAGPVSPEFLRQTLAQNDELTLTKVDGGQLVLRLIDLSGTSLIGVTRDAPDRISVPLNEVTKIERRELSGVMTTFLVAAVAVGIYVVVEAVAEASLASGI